jgi:hypothetical protein
MIIIIIKTTITINLPSEARRRTKPIKRVEPKEMVQSKQIRKVTTNNNKKNKKLMDNI